MSQGFLVLESGECFSGQWQGGPSSVGEIVFNTSHNGYEEIATDPSYYGQMIVMSAPQQGNYGVDSEFWESRTLWIRGFMAVEIQKSTANSGWLDRLKEHGIPAMDAIDSRRLVLNLRENGTQIGAMVQATSPEQAQELARPLIAQFKDTPKDWVQAVTRNSKERLHGSNPNGPKVAVLDFGCKQNILRELQKRCSEVLVYPARSSATEILADQPQGVLLSNGPGDPAHVEVAVDTINDLLGQLPMFGICMGHQLLGRALGGKTFPLKFGHRGANHPIKNVQSNQVFISSQNHGYAIEPDSLAEGVAITHVNLNDDTVAGIELKSKKCFSVQFHPESHPGPRDAEILFDQFMEWMG